MLFDDALIAQRTARFANRATVRDQQMRKNNPIFFRHQRYQIVFNLFRSLFGGQTQPV
jgi:hypothetical protein